MREEIHFRHWEEVKKFLTSASSQVSLLPLLHFHFQESSFPFSTRSQKSNDAFKQDEEDDEEDDEEEIMWNEIKWNEMARGIKRKGVVRSLSFEKLKLNGHLASLLLPLMEGVDNNQSDDLDTGHNNNDGNNNHKKRDEDDIKVDLRAEGDRKNGVVLDFYKARWSSEDVRGFGLSPFLNQVRQLSLSTCSVESKDDMNNLLSHLKSRNRLVQLHIRGYCLTRQCVHCLASWLRQSNCSLKFLSLEHCGIGAHNDGEAFVENISEFQSLLSLSLAGNPLRHLHDQCLELIKCSHLLQLSLGNTPIGFKAEMLFLVGYALRFSSIQSIDLSCSGIGDEELSALIQGFLYNSDLLDSHSSRHCPQGAYRAEEEAIDAFVQLLPTSCFMNSPRLLDINLSHNRITSPAILSPLLLNRSVGLSSLSLSNNRLHAVSFKELCDILHEAESLQFLCLESCGLSYLSLSHLLTALLKSWSKFKEHCLYPLAPSVLPTDECCAIPAPVELWSEDKLVVPYCSVFEEELERFRSEQKWGWFSSEEDVYSHLKASRCVPPIRHLNLASNYLGAQGAKLLKAVLMTRQWHPVEELVLTGNNIGTIGLEALVSALSADTTVRHVWLGRPDVDGASSELLGQLAFAKKPISCIALHVSIKYCFLLCLQKALPGVYLPPEIAREVFSYLETPVWRKVSMV